MEIEIIFSERAEKEIFKLPKQVANRILDKLLELSADNPPTQRAIKLINHNDAEYRYRIGDYRVLFDYNEPLHRIEVLKVAHRSAVYE